MDKLGYRNGFSIEHKIEQLWYGHAYNAFPIIYWSPQDAHREFSLLRSNGKNSESLLRLQMSDPKRSKVVNKLVVESLAEALLSPASYVRTWAELVTIEQRELHE